MSESNLTIEEQDALQRKLYEEELDTPPSIRKEKIVAQKKLVKQLEDPALAGGVRSTLNPIQPHKFRELGELTVALKKEDIKQPSKN